MSTVADVLAGKAQWCVVCADNRELLPGLGDGAVDHVITDPPYAHDYKQMRSGSRHGCVSTPREIGYERLTKSDIESAAASLRVARRWALVFMDIESGHLWIAATPLRYIRTGMWVRSNLLPQFTGDRPAVCGEAVMCMHGPEKVRWNGGGKPAFWRHPQLHGTTGGVANEHPTPKPLGLMLDLVRQFTDTGEVVLDPYAGSGTTGVAALRLGRRVILIEREPKWAALCEERMRAEEQQTTAEASRAGQGALFGRDTKRRTS